MKNVFKFLGLALVAGAMLVSCGKDFTITVTANDTTMGTVSGGGSYAENETATLTATPNEGYKFVKWNDGNTDNPRTVTVTADAEYVATFQAVAVEPPAEGVAVTFGSTTWTSATTTKYYYNGGYYIVACSNADGQSFPLAVIYGASATAGTTSDSFDATSMGYTNGNLNTLDYYEQYALNSSDGSSTYGDWWAKTATCTVNSFDATSLNFSANISAVMFSALKAFVSSAEGYTGSMDTAPTENLTMTINTTLEVPDAKAIANTTKTNKVVVK